jgi:hypothetical protein
VNTRNCLHLGLFVGLCFALAGCDPYAKLLEKQGYTVVDHPRADFGTGTIIKVEGAHESYIAAPTECFPGLDSKIHANPIELTNSKQSSQLSIDAAAKYVPGAVQQVGGSFGFKSIKNIDVSFGKTTGNDLTVEGLAEYLDGAKVSERCYKYLMNDQDRIIVSAARVESMVYTFHGEKDINAKVDAEALKSTLQANGVVQYTSTTDNTLTVNQPMYIGYKSAKFKDLGIIHMEGSDVPYALQKGKFGLQADRVTKKN